MHGASSLFNALLKKRFEFIFLGYMLFGITFTLGSIFYLLEFGINEKIETYLDAIYWALVTISTVGYGDISPVTEVGKVVSMFGIIFGIAMISFVTSVMVSAFSERFDELRNQDSINHVNKMHNVVVINGYGHLGSTIARKLKKAKLYEPVIIEQDEEKVAMAFQDGYDVIRADGSSAKLVKELYQRDNIIAMLTLRSSDIDNIYFILNAKSVVASSIVYTRMNQTMLRAQYQATKVDGIVEPYSVVEQKAFTYLKKHAQDEKKNVIVLGYTHKSAQICKLLKEASVEVLIYETDVTRYEKAISEGFNNVTMQKSDEELPKINHSIVVCAMNEEALNVYYSISLRSSGFTSEIVALSDSKEDNRKLLLAGVSKIFDMYEESASSFVELIKAQDKK
jgi:voltage-gated potassium channel